MNCLPSNLKVFELTETKQLLALGANIMPRPTEAQRNNIIGWLQAGKSQCSDGCKCSKVQKAQYPVCGIGFSDRNQLVTAKDPVDPE